MSLLLRGQGAADKTRPCRLLNPAVGADLSAHVKDLNGEAYRRGIARKACRVAPSKLPRRRSRGYGARYRHIQFVA